MKSAKGNEVTTGNFHQHYSFFVNRTFQQPELLQCSGIQIPFLIQAVPEKLHYENAKHQKTKIGQHSGIKTGFRSYENELTLKICGNCNPLKLHLSGQGLEPRLEFSPPALEMEWVLVDSDGVEATVVVKNPCSFPIEFYSLDFDEQYLEEKKILRMAVGSEYQKNFVMPPRAVGGTLPPEVLEDYEAQKRPKAQRAELRAMAEAEATAEAEAEAMGKAAPAHHRSVPLYPEPMVKATGNPISQAVMRHLGIDPSSERHEAQQQKGIVVVVHGPPRAVTSKELIPFPIPVPEKAPLIF
ncbi:hypothetical protein DUI87_13982 [Hirundo rustica rustica]|uniref:Uncharacterized protein n=1 Tax=Hirundo rustica rustica TaxID=333673 RepID=A0A3M0K7A2_HIRRU|nr:hypothetical protein DUI87_13982 [Hirundo rustica rustica]